MQIEFPDKSYTVDRVSSKWIPRFGTARINFHFTDEESVEVLSLKMDSEDVEMLIEQLKKIKDMALTPPDEL